MVEARLEIYFEHGEGPSYVDTPEGIDTLLDQVATRYWHDWPVLLEVTIADSVGMEHMYAGVYHDRGMVWYSSPEHPACYSQGEAPAHDGELTYYYMENDRQFPSDADVSLDAVKLAVREFLATRGERPSSVTWRPIG
ncbi:MAG TPA: Imm1 family immunity protein [Pseudonocardiaceae bacterium]|nr:Imm1 family immunity protein [Pseudonocardiaceae bacterium]